MTMGLTQASRVIPVVRSREAESLTVTQLLTPLNDRAPPYLPEVDQEVLATVPVLELPEASAAVVPDPSLKPYAATRPVGADEAVPLASFEEGLTLPTASWAVTR